MAEIPDPSQINPKPIEGNLPVDDPKKPEQPTKKFLTMNMTESEFNDFLNNYIKMMLSDIKRGEKNMIEAMRRIADPERDINF